MTDILDRPAPPPDLTMPYGALPEHVIDLRFPPRRPAPLIVLVHGGFWTPDFDRSHLGPMAQALAAAGYVVAVPEYRRAGMAAEGWTGTFDDIAAAPSFHSAVRRRELHPANDTTCVAGHGARHGDPAGSPGRAAAHSTR